NGVAPNDPNAAGDPKVEARDEGEFSAEWFEFELRYPGEPVRKIRRQIFDLIGPAMRASGNLGNFKMSDDMTIARSAAQLMETKILILPCNLSSDYLTDLTAKSVLANKPVLDRIPVDPFSAAPPNYVELFKQLAPLPGPSYSLAAVRFENELTRGHVYV